MQKYIKIPHSPYVNNDFSLNLFLSTYLQFTWFNVAALICVVFSPCLWKERKRKKNCIIEFRVTQGQSKVKSIATPLFITCFWQYTIQRCNPSHLGGSPKDKGNLILSGLTLKTKLVNYQRLLNQDALKPTTLESDFIVPHQKGILPALHTASSTCQIVLVLKQTWGH